MSSGDDSEDNIRIADMKREIKTEIENKDQNLLNDKKSKKKPKLKSSPFEQSAAIKGFVIDEDNRHQCLDCGKKFIQKASYVQHSRL